MSSWSPREEIRRRVKFVRFGVQSDGHVWWRFLWIFKVCRNCNSFRRRPNSNVIFLAKDLLHLLPYFHWRWILFMVKLSVSAHHNLLWGNKYIVLLFFNVGTKLRLVVGFTPRPLYPQDIAPVTYWVGWLLISRTRLDDLERRKVFALAENRATFSHLCSLCPSRRNTALLCVMYWIPLKYILNILQVNLIFPIPCSDFHRYWFTILHYEYLEGLFQMKNSETVHILNLFWQRSEVQLLLSSYLFLVIVL